MKVNREQRPPPLRDSAMWVPIRFHNVAIGLLLVLVSFEIPLEFDPHTPAGNIFAAHLAAVSLSFFGVARIFGVPLLGSAILLGVGGLGLGPVLWMRDVWGLSGLALIVYSLFWVLFFAGALSGVATLWHTRATRRTRPPAS